MGIGGFNLTLNKFRSLAIGDKLKVPGHGPIEVTSAYYTRGAYPYYVRTFHITVLTASELALTLREEDADVIEEAA